MPFPGDDFGPSTAMPSSRCLWESIQAEQSGGRRGPAFAEATQQETLQFSPPWKDPPHPGGGGHLPAPHSPKHAFRVHLLKVRSRGLPAPSTPSSSQ